MGESPFAANPSLVGLTAQLGLVLGEFTEKLRHRMLEGYHRLRAASSPAFSVPEGRRSVTDEM